MASSRFGEDDPLSQFPQVSQLPTGLVASRARWVLQQIVPLRLSLVGMKCPVRQPGLTSSVSEPIATVVICRVPNQWSLTRSDHPCWRGLWFGLFEHRRVSLSVYYCLGSSYEFD